MGREASTYSEVIRLFEDATNVKKNCEITEEVKERKYIENDDDADTFENV